MGYFREATAIKGPSRFGSDATAGQITKGIDVPRLTIIITDLLSVPLIDVSSLRSVRTFANKFLTMNLPLNVLINNAGIMYCPFQLSEEMQFATNHLGVAEGANVTTHSVHPGLVRTNLGKHSPVFMEPTACSLNPTNAVDSSQIMHIAVDAEELPLFVLDV
ncbi:hypothetical protein ZIOFF_024219 [Zingiber officinale]|uniref:Uncharacterized protein n=1 Tax=Zingiber officinale TaxID=94328 RepID=A0A8J5GVY6_ZINOF|nr:hypothetical protein ZIOFF_024219 [Zingiber officinale]